MTGRPSFSSRFLEPYRRITSSGQFIPEVDGLRFLAIFSVFIYHLSGDVLRHTPAAQVPGLESTTLVAVTQVLNLGVPLFFVISGFILGAPFAASHLQNKRPVSLKKYFLRRLTRLEPPYILSLVAFFFLKIASGKGSASALWPNLTASAFYLHNAIFGLPSAINVVAWSLEIEVQFYILAPVIALVFVIRDPLIRRTVLAILILAATGISALVSSNGALLLSLLGFAQYFLIGFAFVEFYLSGGNRRQGHWWWDIVSLGGWVALLALRVHGTVSATHARNFGDSLVTPGTAWATWITPWLILILYIAAFHGVVMNRIVTNPWITTIGGMCYTIYLLHNYFIAALGAFTERFGASFPFAGRLSLQFLLMTPILLVICGVYFRLIERPCMRPNWPQELKARYGKLVVPTHGNRL